MKEKEVELNTVFAMNQFGIVVPAVKVDYGLSDKVEIGAQYEVYSYLAGIRFGVLSSEENGIALALGLSGGQAFYVSSFTWGSLSSGEWQSSAVLVPNITLGKRWNRTEAYLGYKAFFGTSQTYEIGTIKLGGRFGLTKNVYFVMELGETHHNLLGAGFLHVVEGATGFAFKF